MAAAKATRLFEFKYKFSDGAILQMRLWAVPTPVPGSTHLYKYALFYGRPGERVVLYDNERGKGDHRHRRNVESPYPFRSLAALIADFDDDVRREREALESGEAS